MNPSNPIERKLRRNKKQFMTVKETLWRNDIKKGTKLAFQKSFLFKYRKAATLTTTVNL